MTCATPWLVSRTAGLPVGTHAGHAEAVSIVDGVGVTAEMCAEAGGAWIANTGYMVHVWNVPGYESPDGMFTELNRRITCPDGTYRRIPIEDLGSKDTVCRS